LEELNRIQFTAISDIRFVLTDIHGRIRKSAAVHPNVRELGDPKPVKNGFEIDGGTLQKGEEHVFLIEIITPGMAGDSERKALCQVKMKYRYQGGEHEAASDPPIIEYTVDPDLLEKSGHPEVEKYKIMYIRHIQAQNLAADMRAGNISKKTRQLLQSYDKNTRRLGLSKQTKQLEVLDDKMEKGTVSEDDIVALTISSKKTKVLKK